MPAVDRVACDEVLRRLDDYVDRELARDEILQVELHLNHCAACAEAARFEAGLIGGLRSRLRGIAVPAELRDTIHVRLTRKTPYRDDRPDLPSGGP